MVAAEGIEPHIRACRAHGPDAVLRRRIVVSPEITAERILTLGFGNRTLGEAPQARSPDGSRSTAARSAGPAQLGAADGDNPHIRACRAHGPDAVLRRRIVVSPEITAIRGIGWNRTSYHLLNKQPLYQLS